jgi:hypothetical protein
VRGCLLLLVPVQHNTKNLPLLTCFTFVCPRILITRQVFRSPGTVPGSTSSMSASALKLLSVLVLVAFGMKLAARSESSGFRSTRVRRLIRSKSEPKVSTLSTGLPSFQTLNAKPTLPTKRAIHVNIHKRKHVRNEPAMAGPTYHRLYPAVAPAENANPQLPTFSC